MVKVWLIAAGGVVVGFIVAVLISGGAGNNISTAIFTGSASAQNVEVRPELPVQSSNVDLP